MHLTTEVPDFLYFFNYFFSLFYIFPNSGKCNREGLYEPECVKSPAMYSFECYHWNSNPYLIHWVSPWPSRAKLCPCLCWAMSQGNLLTPAEVFCICLSMANTSISPEKRTYGSLYYQAWFQYWLHWVKLSFFSRALYTQISFTEVNTVILHLHPCSLP